MSGHIEQWFRETEEVVVIQTESDQLWTLRQHVMMKMIQDVVRQTQTVEIVKTWSKRRGESMFDIWYFLTGFVYQQKFIFAWGE